MINLKGMTWNHPRAVDPLVACSRAHAASHQVQVNWDARSLEDFEAFPLDELAGTYDLMVIDHPHVGMACASGCLLALDGQGFDEQLQQLNGNTAGRSQESYFYQGHQWALAIDAATQVACRSRFAVDAPWPTRWSQLIDWAKTRDVSVLWPLAPVHAMMSFYTLCANIGQPCKLSGDELVSTATAIEVFDTMRQLSSLLPVECFLMNPIHILEKLATADRPSYVPHSYQYVSYALDGFRANRVAFGNIPGVKSNSCAGSTLGGTGMAVSSLSKNKDASLAYAFFVASSEIQKTLYSTNGGQPAHLDAWRDDALNHATGNFFRGTLATIEKNYLRPRFSGYIPFQQAAGEIVSDVLQSRMTAQAGAARLNDAFRKSQAK